MTGFDDARDNLTSHIAAVRAFLSEQDEVDKLAQTLAKLVEIRDAVTEWVRSEDALLSLRGIDALPDRLKDMRAEAQKLVEYGEQIRRLVGEFARRARTEPTASGTATVSGVVRGGN